MNEKKKIILFISCNVLLYILCFCSGYWAAFRRADSKISAITEQLEGSRATIKECGTEIRAIGQQLEGTGEELSNIINCLLQVREGIANMQSIIDCYDSNCDNSATNTVSGR